MCSCLPNVTSRYFTCKYPAYAFLPPNRKRLCCWATSHLSPFVGFLYILRTKAQEIVRIRLGYQVDSTQQASSQHVAWQLCKELKSSTQVFACTSPGSSDWPWQTKHPIVAKQPASTVNFARLVSINKAHHKSWQLAVPATKLRRAPLASVSSPSPPAMIRLVTRMPRALIHFHLYIFGSIFAQIHCSSEGMLLPKPRFLQDIHQKHSCYCWTNAPMPSQPNWQPHLYHCGSCMAAHQCGGQPSKTVVMVQWCVSLANFVDITV